VTIGCGGTRGVGQLFKGSADKQIIRPFIRRALMGISQRFCTISQVCDSWWRILAANKRQYQTVRICETDMVVVVCCLWLFDSFSVSICVSRWRLKYWKWSELYRQNYPYNIWYIYYLALGTISLLIGYWVIVLYMYILFSWVGHLKCVILHHHYTLVDL